MTNHEGMSRRDMLLRGGAGFGGIVLSYLLRNDPLLAAGGDEFVFSQQPHFKPSAKSVIFLFMEGGPSHLDTFDPKPKAPAEYRGPFSRTATKTPGIQFSELMPRMAQPSNRFLLISERDGRHDLYLIDVSR